MFIKLVTIQKLARTYAKQLEDYERAEDLKEVARGHASELADLRREKIELISRASVIADKVRDDMDRLVNSRLPLT